MKKYDFMITSLYVSLDLGLTGHLDKSEGKPEDARWIARNDCICLTCTCVGSIGTNFKIVSCNA